MDETESVSRRTLLTTAAALAVASTEACAQPAPTADSGNGRILVAYFTRSGNTRVIAGTIQRALGADLFEIRPAQPYPADYEANVAQATRERDSGYEPPLAERVANIAAYDEIYLGFPIWGETAPPIIRSFLCHRAFAGARWSCRCRSSRSSPCAGSRVWWGSEPRRSPTRVRQPRGGSVWRGAPQS